jgi:CRP-like cAMP-binding protein
MANERGQALARVTMFSALSKRQLKRLQKAAGEYRYEQGQELVKEGTPGETLFAILEGSVKVVRGGRTLRKMGPGDYLGEVALFDRRPRTASVIADSEVRCVALHREDLRKLLADEPKAGWKLLESLAGRLRGDWSS